MLILVFDRQAKTGNTTVLSDATPPLGHRVHDVAIEREPPAEPSILSQQEIFTKLPEASTEDPATLMLTLITEFCAEIESVVKGLEPNGLVQKNNAAFGDFKLAIRRTAPGFVAIVGGEGGATSPDIIIDDDEGDPREDSADFKKPIYLGDVQEILRKYGINFIAQYSGSLVLPKGRGDVNCPAMSR